MAISIYNMHCWVSIRKGGALLSVPFGVETMSH